MTFIITTVSLRRGGNTTHYPSVPCRSGWTDCDTSHQRPQHVSTKSELFLRHSHFESDGADTLAVMEGCEVVQVQRVSAARRASCCCLLTSEPVWEKYQTK